MLNKTRRHSLCLNVLAVISLEISYNQGQKPLLLPPYLLQISRWSQKPQA